MATRLDFDGLDAIVNDLNKMSQVLDSSMIDDALEEAIQPAYETAKKNAPRNKKGHIGKYGDGHMADNISIFSYMPLLISWGILLSCFVCWLYRFF